jgi:hypothetical protein
MARRAFALRHPTGGTALAAALADPIPVATYAKREKAKKLIPCRFPVNRLYLQARQNLT